MKRDTPGLRCPVAYIENDHVYRCDLNYGHAQWHLSQEFGYLTIWPHDLRDWAARNKGSEPPETVLQERATVLPEKEPPPTAPSLLPPRFRPRFTPEDWAENCPLSSEECLHANPRLYGLPDDESRWWEFVRGWEPEDGVLSEKELREARVYLAHWRANESAFLFIRESEFS